MAERFNEADVYAALGMEAPAKTPEVADPAGQNGANEPAATEPAGAEERTEEAAPGTEPGTEPEAEAKETAETEKDQAEKPGEASVQSKAERARQAQMRRERETQARVEAAVRAEREKAAADLKKVFAKAGMTDRYNGNKPITTMEEFEAWDKAGQAAGLSRRLQEGKLTAEDFQQAVDNSPAVQEARRIAERLRQKEQAQAKEEYQVLVEQELAEIRKLDPSVTDLKSILDRDTGAEFSKLVQENGLTFLQAFRLANSEQLSRAQAMAAAEGKARAQHGKDHMRSTVAPGGAFGEVPRGTVELYRQLDPEMTMDEIRKDYFARMGQGRK